MDTFIFTVFAIEIFVSKLCNDPDQIPHFVASELDLHCLYMFLKWVYSLKKGENVTYILDLLQMQIDKRS